MYKIILVGVGGFIGAVLRYGIAGYIHNLTRNIPFYYSTLTVNIIGCFLIGILTQIFEQKVHIPDETRLLLIVGLLGAFTTYSAFSNDTYSLFRENRIFLSLMNIGLHIFLGLAAVLMGRVITISILKKI
ncbi:MAG: fluoride efflux transporter CrcB [Acidobacteriota bacterium]